MPKPRPAKKTTKPRARKSASTPAALAEAPALERIASTLGFLALTVSDYKNKTDTEQIIFLSNLGFDRNSIAGIVGTTPNTVSVRLSEAKASQPK